VSSKSQDTAAQDADLKAWAERQSQPVKWYTDTATGTNMDRAGFQSIMDRVRAGEVETIVVWRMDRLGRTAVGLVKLFEEIREAKVNLVSLRDSFDLSTPGGRLQANILASVAAYETEVRSERQMAGIAAAKAAGRTWGGSAKGRRLKVTDEQLATVRRLKAEKMPVSQIARAVGLSRPTIYALN
jgi:DNA invertase Pin-like site-specific DNA recombinase